VKTWGILVVYGMGPGRLGRAIGKSFDEATQILDIFWSKFPGVAKFLDERVQEALRDECVRSYMDNRLRWLKGFDLRMTKQSSHASNIAKNMSLQSVDYY
jgi:DNA polymerase I-like protein with 3'-5' exonuclease and polymerase domains